MAHDEDWRALHNHSRHARQDILHADRQPPPVRPVPGRHRLADSERAAFRLWCLESDRCTGVRPAEDFSIRHRACVSSSTGTAPAGWLGKQAAAGPASTCASGALRSRCRPMLQALPSQPRNTFLITIDGRLVKIAVQLDHS